MPPPAFLLVFQITKKARKIAFVHHAWVDVTGVQKWRRMQENAGMHFYRLFPILVGSWSADINSLFRKVKRAGNPLPSFVPLSLINLLYPARCVEPIELWWIDGNNGCYRWCHVIGSPRVVFETEGWLNFSYIFPFVSFFLFFFSWNLLNVCWEMMILEYGYILVRLLLLFFFLYEEEFNIF